MPKKFKALTEQHNQLIKELEVLREHLHQEISKTRAFNCRAAKTIQDSYNLLKRDENLFLILE